MSRTRKVQILILLASSAAIVGATAVSPWLAGVVLLILGAFGTMLLKVRARSAVLERAMIRNDIPEIERFVGDPFVGTQARIALAYARIDTPDLFECTCGACDPGDSLVNTTLASFDEEVHAHARLAQAFWMPSRAPKDWIKAPQATPEWSLPIRQIATLGVSLARTLESPTSLEGHRTTLGFFARLGEIPPVLRWPTTLAAARYAAEVGLYGEAQRWLSQIPPWTARSPLEAIRRTCSEALDEHHAQSGRLEGTTEAEDAFLRAACFGDTQALLAIARDPSHHAALASRVLLALDGYTFDQPLRACPCTHCSSSDDDATLAALTTIASRIWSDEPFGTELRDEVDALARRRISRHARAALYAVTRTLHGLIGTLHTCPEERCAAGTETEKRVDDEALPSRSVRALAAATRSARRHELSKARELLGTVGPFGERSAVERHRRALSASLGAEPEAAAST